MTMISADIAQPSGPLRSAGLTKPEAAELASRLARARDAAGRSEALAIAMTHAARGNGGHLPRPVGRAIGGALSAIDRDLAPEPFLLIRIAGDAARNAVLHPARAPAATAATSLAAATATHAPHLLPALAGGRRVGAGRWVRDGEGRIVVHLAAAPPRLVDEEFEYDPEMEYFLGGLIHSIGKAAGDAVKTVSKVADKASNIVSHIPVVGDVAKGLVGVARTGIGPLGFAIDAGVRLAKGESFGRALQHAGEGQIGAVRDQLHLAEMVAPFIPGLGTGVAAAIGAANALASGRPITDAIIAAARGAIPGGAVAQAAFDVAANLARGQNITDAALNAAREQLPGGPAAKAAFDAATALAKGKRLQDVAFATAGRLLPPSPYAADALDFVRRVANGQNIQHAALSVAGQHALKELGEKAGAAFNKAVPGAADLPRAAQQAARSAAAPRQPLSFKLPRPPARPPIRMAPGIESAVRTANARRALRALH